MAEPKLTLTHYVFVRRDLPLGVLAAMVTHAAGESGALYCDAYDGRFRGATAVVLEARNELHLDKIAENLRLMDIPCVEVWENSGPYAEQLMAIGVVPRERDARLNDYQLLKGCVDN
jgi:hypothetical protein